MKRAALLLPLLAFAGCGGGVPDYFPLDPGQSWDYRISFKIKGEVREHRLLLGSLPAKTVEGKVYYPRRRLDGNVEYHERTDDGVLRVDPVSGRRERVLPTGPAPGGAWHGNTHIYFLEVTGVFTPTFEKRVQESIPFDYVIESAEDTVTVAAGTFERCLRVKSSGSMFAGGTLRDFMGIRFIKVEQTEWYAPGVGLVKRVRNEFTTPAEWSNEYVMELVGYNR